ncbi:IS200/IS605 family transposase [Acidithiobacillus ferriphilus]|uniref:IS200/IS605 family transposase n=1 Tax=Acidithiobacillus ferriphilus TaxID=1689834 RepID=UPI003AF0CB2E
MSKLKGDHVHLLVEIHPALNISTLINNLKTASARRARTRFASTSNLFIGNRFFLHRAYYVGSVGGAILEAVRRYGESHGTKEKPRKAQRPA